HQGPGESSLEVACVNPAGGDSRDVILPAMFTLAVMYFAVLFPTILFWPRTPASRSAVRAELRRERQRR
ncbi:MAG TPA: hypothetical protein VEQ60_23230, partial [Longimicrobium sp.]|nr:hypothetical protein [Longimicrobium sp.]